MWGILLAGLRQGKNLLRGGELRRGEKIERAKTWGGKSAA